MKPKLCPSRNRPSSSLFPIERIEQRILLIRGHKVMLDTHLAELYQVETRVLVQAVKRNARRFPADFMFQLTAEETKSLTSQFVMSNERPKERPGRGGRRTLPYRRQLLAFPPPR
jgi:hypothetical protein